MNQIFTSQSARHPCIILSNPFLVAQFQVLLMESLSVRLPPSSFLRVPSLRQSVRVISPVRSQHTVIARSLRRSGRFYVISCGVLSLQSPCRIHVAARHICILGICHKGSYAATKGLQNGTQACLEGTFLEGIYDLGSVVPQLTQDP